MAARDASKERKRSRRENSTGFTGVDSRMQVSSRNEHLTSDSYLLRSEPIKRDYTLSSEGHENVGRPYHPEHHWHEEERDLPGILPPLRPNRKKGNDIELGSEMLTETNLSRHNLRVGSINPMISNYVSPIDFASYSNPTNGARLTFTRQ